MRSRQAAQQHPDLDQSRSPTSQAHKHDAREPPQVGRRRSHRVSKSTSQGASSKPTLSRRQSSGTAESMESDSYPQNSSQMANSAGASRQASRGSNPPESIRYTPVTGRVSRAKKGQPVHVCEQCDPPRVGDQISLLLHVTVTDDWIGLYSRRASPVSALFRCTSRGGKS